MALSIKWLGPPKSYSAGRPRKARFIVLHYTAGAEGPNAAEDGAAYDRKRTDGTSTGYFTDSTPGVVVQTVKDSDRSHTALYHGNEIGIHIEICGTRQSREQWLDATSKATLENTAALVAHLCKTHGFPVRRLSTSQVRSAYYAPEDQRGNYEGITDHNGCTQAFPEDGGTHTDVGPEFPWDVFLDMVNDAMEGNDMDPLTKDQTTAAVWTNDAVPRPPAMFGEGAGDTVAGKSLVTRTFDEVGIRREDGTAPPTGTLAATVLSLVGKVDALAEKIDALATGDLTHEQIKSAVVAALRDNPLAPVPD